MRSRAQQGTTECDFTQQQTHFPYLVHAVCHRKRYHNPQPASTGLENVLYAHFLHNEVDMKTVI